MPVNESHFVEKTFFHRNVSDIGTPYLVGMIDINGFQQIGIDFVRLVRFAQIGLLVDSADPHYFEETYHPFYINAIAHFLKIRMHTENAEKRPFEMELIPVSYTH